LRRIVPVERVSTDPAAQSCNGQVLIAILSNQFGLRGAPRLDDIDWARIDADFVDEAVRHRLLGILAENPALELLPNRVQEGLARRRRQQTFKAMSQAVDIVHILGAFSASRIPTLAIKGQAMSAMAYGNWTARGVSADLDLLVPPQSLVAVHCLLLDLGYVCEADGNHRAPLEGWWGKYNTWLHYERSYRASGSLGIDIHWRPVPGSASWTAFDAIWAERVTVDLHGRQVATPGPETALRIAATQGIADGWPTLRSAVDVVAVSLMLGEGRLRQLGEEQLVREAVVTAKRIITGKTPTGTELDGLARRKRQWIERSWTDSRGRALARSVLGLTFPARRGRRWRPPTA
jgi:hypothetical protein